MLPAHTVTVLLREAAAGNKAALDNLIPLVYEELRRLAQNQIRHERPGHTLQATALVHEAYARMLGQEGLGSLDRAHFLGVAAHTMRKILIDHARTRNAAKRGGGEKQPFDEARHASVERPALMLALDDAMNALERVDPTESRLMEMRYFGGMTAEESAAVLKLDVYVVRRELRLAEAWLRREMGTDAPSEEK